MIPARLYILATFAAALPLFAQERPRAAPLPPAAAPPQAEFVVECQMVTIPGKLLPTLLPELNDEKKAADEMQKLQAMIARGEAILTAHLSARGLIGGKTVAESVGEIIYTDEYHPPTLPATTPLEPALEVLKNWPYVGTAPRALSARQVGQTLEIAVARTTDPKRLSVSSVLQHMRFEKMLKIDIGETADGERQFIEEPIFSSMRDQFGTVFEIGLPKLISVHRLPGPEGVYELFLMTLRSKPEKIHVAAAGRLSASGAFPLPQEPKREGWNVRSEVRMVALPLAQALSLVPRLRSPATFAAAEQRVEALLAGGEAELVNWVQLQSETEQKTTTESIAGVLYPTEWNPTVCPFLPPEPSFFRSSILESLPGFSSGSLGGIAMNLIPKWFFEPFEVPFAFDTRNTGATVEMEPAMDAKSGELEVSVSVKLVRFEGLERTIAGRPGPPTFRGFPMARFTEYNVQTNFQIANGAGALLGTFTLQGPKPRLLLFLYRGFATPQPPSLP